MRTGAQRLLPTFCSEQEGGECPSPPSFCPRGRSISVPALPVACTKNRSLFHPPQHKAFPTTPPPKNSRRAVTELTSAPLPRRPGPSHSSAQLQCKRQGAGALPFPLASISALVLRPGILTKLTPFQSGQTRLCRIALCWPPAPPRGSPRPCSRWGPLQNLPSGVRTQMPNWVMSGKEVVSQRPVDVNSQFSVWFHFNEQLLNICCVRRSVTNDSRCPNIEVEEGLCEPVPEDTNTTRHGPQL